jgi:hypothetical protein
LCLTVWAIEISIFTFPITPYHFQEERVVVAALVVVVVVIAMTPLRIPLPVVVLL